MMRSILLAAGILAGASILIADAVSTGGGGKGIGLGVAGSVGPGGRGGGGPLPALGATLLGQAIGAGGLFALWRRRRNKNH
jgi:uncharacterized membrane protein YccC